MQFTPRPYQMEFFDAMNKGTKRALLRWHRQSGKDAACFVFTVSQALSNPGQTFYYFLDTYAQAKKVIWEAEGFIPGTRLLDIIPPEAIESKNQTEMSIRLKNKSIIRLIGADKADRIVGTHLHGVVLSEYAVFDNYPELWSRIEPSVLYRNGWAIFNSTPRGRNHMYDLEKAVNGNPTWYVDTRQTLWPDRPHYTGVIAPDRIDQARITAIAKGEEDPEMWLEQEYGVSYGAIVSGSYYQELIQRARNEGRIGHYPANPNLYIDTYWDLGGTDDTCIWFIQQEGNRRVIVDYYEGRQKMIGEYVEVLRAKGYKYRNMVLPWDGGTKTLKPATASLLEEGLVSANILANVLVVPRTKDRQGMINATRNIFHTFYFNEPLVHLGLRKLELYKRKYDVKTGTYTDPVHDKNSHAADALRMIAESVNLIDKELDNDPNSMIYYDTEFDVYNPYK